MGKVRGVIHVGAHEGEELPGYLLQGIRDIIWIEANPRKLTYLTELTSNYNSMHVASFAAGSRSGDIVLNISNNGQSSSVLQFGTHSIEHPDVTYVDHCTVKLARIDDWIDQASIDRSTFNFLNIDIQGYELEALKGSVKQLHFVDYVYTEVNVNHLYQGCPLIDEVDLFWGLFGFTRISTAITQHGWGDAFYFKTSA